MSLLDKEITVVEARKCPLYKANDIFSLSGIGLMPPGGKPACVFLVRVIAEKFIEDMSGGPPAASHIDGAEFNCPGCKGLIKVAVADKGLYQTLQMQMLMAAERRRQFKTITSLESMLSSFSFFQAVDDKSLKEIISHLSMVEFEVDDIILKLGTPGQIFYIITSGRVALYNAEDQHFATLGRGEILGEMSLLNDQPVSASAKAIEPVKTFALRKNDFLQIMVKYPYIRNTFNRILIQRLMQTAMARSPGQASGMICQLEELAAAELFQMIHENKKSGICNLDFTADHKATVVFKDGEIVAAFSQDQRGSEALFAILKEQKGVFQFSFNMPVEYAGSKPIGGFMKMLMEGLRRIDEGK